MAGDDLYRDLPNYFEDQRKDLFWAKVNRVDCSCWDWLGSRDRFGYGFHVVPGLTRMAHRFSWMLANGPIESGFEIDHLCRNRGCVRPDHLQVVPRGFNAAQGRATWNGMRSVRALCRHSHPCGLTVTPNKKKRVCRECARLSCRRSYWKSK